MEGLLLLESEAKNLLAAGDHPCQQSWLEELLQILEAAEFLYGPRDSSYQLRAPLMTECYTSMAGVVFPFRSVRIYLSRDCNDRQTASYTLAHEAIHVLGPAYGLATTVLEEGLASYFSLKYMNETFGREYDRTGDPDYDAAMHAVSTLLAKDKFVIKKLRTHQPTISRIDEELLVEVAGIERSHVSFLATRFHCKHYAAMSIDNVTKSAQLFARGFRSLLDQSRPK